MIEVRSIQDRMYRWAADWTVLLRQHRNAALAGFGLGAGLFFTAGILYPKHYTGSALIALKPGSEIASQPGLAAALQQLRARQDWAAVVTQFHLYPEVVADSGVPHAAAYLASQVSIEEIQTGDTGSADLRIGFAGPDRDTVLGVTDMVAAGFTKPTGVVAPVAAQAPRGEISGGGESLYAPVVLPTIPVKEDRKISKKARKSERKAIARTAAASAALTKRLDASLTEGLKLQQALTQNALTLDELKKQQEKAQAVATLQASSPPKATVAKPDAQEERLHQELAKAQKTLGDLRERYTEEYPDVVAAKQKVQDLELDASRIAAATPHIARQEPEPRRVVSNLADLGAITAQISQAESAQSRLREAIQQNLTETTWLRSELAKSGGGVEVAPDTSVALPLAASPQIGASLITTPPTSPAVSSPVSSSFFLLQQARVSTAPVIFARQFLWLYSLLIGFLAALLAAWLSERRDPSIRNEDMLRQELPPSAAYLGGIPRIRHEVIAD